ncbi:MAG: hypothetical protein JJ848_000205 [Prochlorococcus marinus CUG1439]|uniref:hypothetical protein n=1 Tax=Prochlorococcus sp. MIT 1314 TaxID=3096220 RepID=UPI001B2CB75E|nr:hypothetical protein [Prochlorococcus sp. MIT 1314]MCR8538764.1 hypothetical protein [Prochlorococcus marinus CUG1439]
MCGFITTISIKEISNSDLLKANEYISSRGPDQTNRLSFKKDGFYYQSIHNLLDISNSFISQPIFSDLENLLLFNGEIYHPRNETPDTLNLYKELKNNNLSSFLKSAIGEYAICTINIRQKLINIFTDLIGTKPIYLGIKKDSICISSYQSAIKHLSYKEIREIPPNKKIKIEYIDFDNLKINYQDFFVLDLKQYNNSYDSWIKAFINSVKARSLHFKSKICVPLSAGYDSGAICCALNKLRIPYSTVTVGNSENKKILKKRISINKSFSCIKHYQIPPLNKKELEAVASFLNRKLGNIKYSHKDTKQKEAIMLHEDSGALGLATLCKEMSSKGFNVIISGGGADEIISDYGFNGKKIYSHSEFGGKFPKDLKSIFPWKKFYGDSQRSYLKKDEMVSGIYGMEGRYPFLDLKVIQEFLNLNYDLKNEKYKSCISEFLERENYPFEKNEKEGFNPMKSEINIFKKLFIKSKKLFKRIPLIN